MDAEQFLSARFGELLVLGLLQTFAASGGIGLLIGLERERHPGATAGLRTFALTALFGTAAALLGELGDTPWPTAIGLLLVGAMAVAAQRRAAVPSGDPGTTTTIALLLCFVLGAMVWHDLATIAASLAVAATALLYFKPELSGLSTRLSRRDMLSILQFAALSLVVLPALPNRGYGPQEALNPHQIWLMVVLVSGVSLAGYVALRVVGARHGLLLIGFLGGLVSSTATTVMYARRAREEPAQARASALVVLIAGCVGFARIALVAALLAPALLAQLAPALLAGFVPMLLAGLLQWRGLPAATAAAAEPTAPEVGIPTELPTALTFGAFYAVVLLLAALLTQWLGGAGLYGLAALSGLTDVDAVSLSSLRLFGVGGISATQASIAIALAFVANVAFKFGIAGWIGGRPLVRQCGAGFLASAAALLFAVAALQGSAGAIVATVAPSQ